MKNFEFQNEVLVCNDIFNTFDILESIEVLGIQHNFVQMMLLPELYQHLFRF